MSDSNTHSKSLHELIASAIAHADLWLVGPDLQGQRRYDPVPYSLNKDGSPWRKQLPEAGFTEDALTQYDARITKVLNHEYQLAEERVKRGQGMLNRPFEGRCLRYSLELWRGELLKLPAAAFIMLASSRHVQKVGAEDLWVELVERDHGEDLLLDHDKCMYARTSTGLRYIETMADVREKLSIKWMDQHYPDWREAEQMASALNITGPQLKELLFPGSSNALTKNTAVNPDVAFD